MEKYGPFWVHHPVQDFLFLLPEVCVLSQLLGHPEKSNQYLDLGFSHVEEWLYSVQFLSALEGELLIEKL